MVAVTDEGGVPEDRAATGGEPVDGDSAGADSSNGTGERLAADIDSAALARFPDLARLDDMDDEARAALFASIRDELQRELDALR